MHLYPLHRRPIWTCTECGFQNDIDEPYCTGFLCKDSREDEENDTDEGEVDKVRRDIAIAAYHEHKRKTKPDDDEPVF